MAVAKKHGRKKKRRAGSSPRPTSASTLRSVHESSSPTTTTLASRFGVAPSTVRRWALAGKLAAVIDGRGRYHFPGRLTRPPSSSRETSASSRKKRKKLSKAPSRPKPKATSGKREAGSGKLGETRDQRRPPPSRPKPEAGVPGAFRGEGVGTRSPKPPSSEFAHVRHVESSDSPSVAEASKAFGVSTLRLLEWVKQGRVRALLDSEGVFHIPAAELQAKQLALRQKRRKKKREGKQPRPPWKKKPTGKKARPSKKPTGKKARRRKKKKKRVRKTKPPRQRFEEAIISDTGPSIHAPPAPPPPRPITAHDPMVMAEAMQRVGVAMKEFVEAGPAWERLATGRVFHDLKVSFRSTYGKRNWHRAYEELVDQFELEDFIFDYEALRDS